MPVLELSMAFQRSEYVCGLTTHSPDESLVLVTFGSYSQVWMLRPPTALLVTVTSAVKFAPNWLPQPIGQVEAFIIVESPAIQMWTGSATASARGAASAAGAAAGAACPLGQAPASCSVAAIATAVTTTGGGTGAGGGCVWWVF